MSYSRWSTDIKNTVPIEEEIELYKQGKTFKDIKKLREGRGAELSQWYIFHHMDSGDTRDTQNLAVWCVKGDDIPTLDYAMLRNLYDNGGWEEIYGEDIPQLEYMRSKVKLFLDNVEEEYKENDSAG